MRAFDEINQPTDEREGDTFSATSRVFWLSALAAAALALFAVYGGNLIHAPAGNLVQNGPATPFGDFVQLADRINQR